MKPGNFINPLQQRKHQALHRWFFVSFFLMTSLTISFCYLQLKKKKTYEKIKLQASVLTALPKENKTIRAVSNIAVQRTYHPYDLFTLLADLVPEDLLVTSLAYCAKKIMIKGNAKSATAIFTFIRQLSEQRDFTKVALIQLQKGEVDSISYELEIANAGD